MRVRAYYRQSEMFFSRLIVRAVELTTVVAAVNQYARVVEKSEDCRAVALA